MHTPQAVCPDKTIWLLGTNPYTFNIEWRSTRTEIKHWSELFFGVKAIFLSSDSREHYRHMIIRLQPGYSIPPLRTNQF
uniref:ribosomal protein L23 n=1 Tax=Linum grandiflorum TaxID=559336 RepID=UPI001D12796B|nr:ribosomal protein L23 [Linum grandiflorum]UBK11755.1 ribosomal protein L23 [Linum grandiflorum]